MKTKLLGYLAAAALAMGAVSASAANVSVSVFYDSLEPHGEWFDTPDYGYVWHPRGVDENWRPYTVGNWAYTDAGWTWVSEEPFGWATYHYGRWVEIDRGGWTWVPDREWGPAWVSWRRSDRHVGWAPLPPEARFEARVGFSGWVDSYYDIGPTYYSFVNTRDFGAPRLRTVILEPRENLTIIRETRNITNITYQNNVIFNGGPDYDVVVRKSAQPIRRLKLERRSDLDYRRDGDRNRFAAQVSGDTLRVAAPEVEVSRDVKPGRLGRKLERVDVDRGWKRAGDPQAVEQFRTSVAAESRAPAELPPKPKLAGSDRQARDNRQTGAATEPATAPGAAPTAETATRDMKPGAEKPPTDPAARTKAERERMKSPTTAETQPATEKPATPTTAETAPATRDKNREGKEKEKSRTSGVAETTAAEQEKTKAMARQQAEAKEKQAAAAAAAPTREKAERPNATERERMPKRPDARDSQQPQAPTAPSTEETPRKRNQPAPQNPAADTERPRTERPEADRSNRNPRPESAVERQPAAPPPSAEDREPERKGPPATENRSPDRAKPEAAQRSPESQPPAPEARGKGAPTAGKPEQGDGRGEKDDKKKD